MNAVVIVLGFILLTIGHQLPWVFVAAAGYRFRKFGRSATIPGACPVSA